MEKYNRYLNYAEALDSQLAEGQTSQAMIDFLNDEIQRVEGEIAAANAMDEQIAGWEATEINAGITLKPSGRTWKSLNRRSPT